MSGCISASVYNVIMEMARRIVAAVHPTRIILFGSHARGEGSPDSDVDLLIVVQDGRAKRKTAVAIYRLLAGIGLAKDIIVMTAEEVERYRNVVGTIGHAAAREGKVLYEHAA